MKSVTYIFLILASALLSSCQTADLADGIDPQFTVEQSHYGNGESKIGLILPTLTQQNSSTVYKDYLDGAKLAADVLGAGQLKLLIYETDGSKSATIDASNALIERDVDIVLGTTSQSNGRLVVQTVSKPTIALMPNALESSKGLYAFLDDSISAVNHAISASANRKRENIVLFYPSGYSGDKLGRVRQQIERIGATLTKAILYSEDIEKNQKLFISNGVEIGKADIAVYLGNIESIANLTSAIQQAELRFPLQIAEIEPNYLERALLNSQFNSIVFASPPKPKIQFIEAKFQEKFAKKPSPQAALGFDLVAVVAGIARAGKLGIDVSTQLTNKKGFEALNGIFRFTSDGNIQRKHEVFQFRNGQLKLIQEIGTGF